MEATHQIGDDMTRCLVKTRIYLGHIVLGKDVKAVS